ncbi:hypothetical protein BP6252_00841 [Coleophoma cylindrospora]|uniref:Uncharacterized protein n=1 Tax=Coleophoma cylindrospora TaxID=1849047 RepID=A0A3D8SR76_9HELO|nr:hypothetical protein BP6252_00841 [Coleophoma cylindrospora]
MGLKKAWRAVSTGWVVEFPDRERGPEDIFSSISARRQSCHVAVEPGSPRTPKHQRTFSVAGMSSPPPEYEVEDEITPSEDPNRPISRGMTVGETYPAGTTQAECSLSPIEHISTRSSTQPSSNARQELQVISRPAQQPIQQSLQQGPPPYTKPPQFRNPSAWIPHMSNSQTRHWLTEHFLAVTHDLVLASQLANKYRYGNGNTLFRMRFGDLCDVDGVEWAEVVWKALGR